MTVVLIFRQGDKGDKENNPQYFSTRYLRPKRIYAEGFTASLRDALRIRSVQVSVQCRIPNAQRKLRFYIGNNAIY